MSDPNQPDLLAGATWQCAPSAPGGGSPSHGWLPATVPGTAAGARRAAEDPGWMLRDYDAEDWWFRCTFVVARESAGPYVLSTEGISTVADVLVDERMVLHSENMFAGRTAALELAEGEHTLVVRCSALGPRLAGRRPRPRWKSPDLRVQNLRWFRTTLIGRQTGGVAAPAPVGPWRPVALTAASSSRPTATAIATTYSRHAGGRLDLTVRLPDALSSERGDVVVEVAGRAEVMTLAQDGTEAAGHVDLPDAQAWWPFTHGEQTRYDVTVRLGDTGTVVGTVGFRQVSVDRTEGAFTLLVNGEPIFCRGVCWTPLDPVTLSSDAPALRAALLRLRDAGLNMVRVTGVGVYESDAFYDLCDELGLLVWQDCMFAFFDAPDDPGFRAEVEAELRSNLGRLQGRPCLAVVCGGSENEQQAAYLGLPPDRWAAPIAVDLIPRLVDELVPGTVYVRSTPGESPLPSMVNRGPGNYFGIGAYLAPLEDARRAQVRFATECLSFANPAEPLDTPAGRSVARGLGHAPAWKASIHRDATTTWDLEDVRDHYTSVLFGTDPTYLRRVDGARAHLLARATVAAVYESTLAEWRRAGSSCAGALVLQAHDVELGGGLGVVDGLGRPKSSWYVMRRLLAPAVVIWSDEGVNGMGLHVSSDRRSPWEATIRLEALVDGTAVAERVELTTPVREGGATVETATVFGGFRDLSHAHRFGPPAYDVIVATLFDEDQRVLSRGVHLPGQRLRPIEPDLGLRAVAAVHNGHPCVTVTSRRFAQWVSFDLDGWYPQDSWFHVVPNTPVRVRLMPVGASSHPVRGAVTAVNAARAVSLETEPA